MRKRRCKTHRQWAAGVLLPISILCLLQLSPALEVLADDHCVKIQSNESVENIESEKIISLRTKLNMSVNSKDSLFRIVELISDYKKGIEHYVG